MDFGLSDEQVALADTLSRFVEEHYSSSSRAQALALPQGYDPSKWRTLAELGLVLLALREENGGLSGSAIDMMVALQAMGPGLILDPWLPTIMVARIIERIGSVQQKQDWLGSLATGELSIGFAHQEANAWGHLHHCKTRAMRDDTGGYRLRGGKVMALGDYDGRVLITARTSGTQDDPKGITFFMVENSLTGLSRKSYRLVDGGLARAWHFNDCHVEATAVVGSPGQAFPVLQLLIAEACAMLASEAIGILDKMRADTAEHLRTRRQFGSPLSSFQVLQHRMADCVADLELARALVLKAAILMSDPTASVGERCIAAFGAKAFCGSASIRIAEECVQFHGAIGLTEELWIGRAMKRLLLIASLFGDARAQTERNDRILRKDAPR